MQLKRRWWIVAGTMLLAGMVAWSWAARASAADGNGEFYLQVSPSPLVATVQPGQSTTLEIKIHNAGPTAENLRIAPRSFRQDPVSQKISINDTTPPEIAGWLQFSAANFTVKAGDTFSEKVTLNVPKEAGFSYSFIFLISRADNSKDPATGRVLKGSVALFTLINVDRPGAVRKLELANLTTTKKVYDHLPVTFRVSIKNSGNTIARPLGSLFVQRRGSDKNPIDTLEINQAGGFILPGSTRAFEMGWDNGFQVAHTITADDGSTKTQTSWNWGRLSSLRLGRYTAKLVGIYNDGHRDVPFEGQVTFWVIPWKIILVLLLIAVLVGAGLWSILSKLIRLSKRVRRS